MTDSAQPRLLVTLCTYNERENLELLIPEIHKYLPSAAILVIDDNSPDGTGEYAKELKKTDSRIHSIHRSGKLGLGTATIAGFQYAIENHYDLVLNLDADFSHPPRFMPDLVEATKTADVAIGSRYIPGGKIEGWGPKRYFMSGAVNWYSRLLLRLKSRDCSGSFRCYRVPKLAEIDFALIRARGYAFQEEILYRCRRVGCTFKEVPFTFEERRFGSSKINLREAFSALWVMLVLGIDNCLGKRVRTLPSDSGR
ncbi:polyprenol monophosphomannose synthase [Gimesia maris]|jgi:dolichol-phosphate mannosyltransferase|uniref:Polyprenol monophosphomannose synthase n=1 Tax=Gimesia maris TaxID=122 RepID=A0A3D3R3N6_9PLAN|nr:polyprenol monophosphomannose synthase [Gimesia maris]MAC52953.1 glycosyl transferase [Gimesia sp.]HAW32500.1 polyprenol monophosphomannose synthase [Planctomycetaceae bacterium]QDT79031.1 Undecaprenyl-phosphate mannosyltransferase [Gimesia maris]QDU14568.1 Undecaprenyl-phosphate mannosyltransferase [Gimesia maris]HCO23196.1 polyprenol monophosphomannose synthase [Gimesia maris]|tara:strand:+ start:592 stop:1353 length:762 start_codon:yes stop_codon:yes gene_type:complete